MVSRRERSALIKKFKQEQKVERRRYKSMVRLEWEEDIAERKENLSQEGEVVGSSSTSSDHQHPADPDTMAEAYEDYLFDRMMLYDWDAAHLLVHFRASLRVVPEQDLRDETSASSSLR
jgi:hypothetical protein